MPEQLAPQITGTQPDKEELRRRIASIIDVDAAEVTDQADFVEDLDVDSLMAMEITVQLEQVYGIRLGEAEMRNLTSLQGTYQVLAEKLRAKP